MGASETAEVGSKVSVVGISDVGLIDGPYVGLSVGSNSLVVGSVEIDVGSAEIADSFTSSPQ